MSLLSVLRDKGYEKLRKHVMPVLFNLSNNFRTGLHDMTESDVFSFLHVFIGLES